MEIQYTAYSVILIISSIISLFLAWIAWRRRGVSGALILKEANRILKDDGILYLADFGQNWENSYYSQRYESDYPKTGEMGTFIVTKNGNPCGRELFKAHHYNKKELMELFEQVKKFKVEKVHETVFTTFQGNETKGYIIIARKK